MLLENTGIGFYTNGFLFISQFLASLYNVILSIFIFLAVKNVVY